MLERYISPALRNNRRLPTIQRTLTGVETAIHDRIWSAILDRKLRLGTKLQEDLVGKTFGVSRTVVRKVFLIMEQEGIISLPLNRGAFVAIPAPDEVKHLFETLRLVMPHIIRNLTAALDDDMKARLESHFEIEENAKGAQDLRISRRLVHEYYILLADMHGNPVIAGLVERLMVRAAMAVTQYRDQNLMMDWRPSDHYRQITNVILANDAEKAVKILYDNINEIEQSLQFEGRDSMFDIGSILSADDTVYPKVRRSGKTRTHQARMETGKEKKIRKA